MKQYTTITIGTKECTNYAAKIVGETEKAYKMEILSVKDAIAVPRIEWLPKSQTKVEEKDGNTFITLTPWIALQKSMMA